MFAQCAPTTAIPRGRILFDLHVKPTARGVSERRHKTLAVNCFHASLKCHVGVYRSSDLRCFHGGNGANNLSGMQASRNRDPAHRHEGLRNNQRHNRRNGMNHVNKVHKIGNSAASKLTASVTASALAYLPPPTSSYPKTMRHVAVVGIGKTAFGAFPDRDLRSL